MTPAARRPQRPANAPERYIAFLRAINVGGHTVKMDVLRGHFAHLGFTGIETFIASGNVIFQSTGASARELEERIAEELARRLGYEVATFLRLPAELRDIVRQRPFDPAAFDYDQHPLYVGFLPAPPSVETVRKIVRLRTPVDELHVEGRELYWGLRTRFSETALSGALLERTLGLPMTLRSATTIRKLAAKYGG